MVQPHTGPDRDQAGLLSFVRECVFLTSQEIVSHYWDSIPSFFHISTAATTAVIMKEKKKSTEYLLSTDTTR